MKESKRCGLISLLCAILACVSVVMVIYSITHQNWGSIVWSGLNSMAGVVLGVGFYGLRKYWLRMGQ